MSPSQRSFARDTIASGAAPDVAHQHTGDADVHHPHSNRAGFTVQMHERMRSMADAMDRAPMTGDPDRDFLAMMIPHHQGAIDMAQLVLVHGQDPLTRQLAEEIIASQQVEISSMTGRLDALGHPGAVDMEIYPALTGTRGKS